MKLSIKIPLLIGIVVLIATVSIIVPMEIIMGNNIRATVYEELDIRVEANAELMNTKLEGRLNQLWEVANRARTRTMDWENIVRPGLMPDIARLGVLEMMMIDNDGVFHYVTDGAIRNLAIASYTQAAFNGIPTVSDVIISQAINSAVVMLAVPIMENDEPNARVKGVLMARDHATILSDLAGAINTRYPSGHAFMMNNEGVLVAYPDHEMVINQFNLIKEAESDPSFKSMAEMAAAAIKQRNGRGYYTKDGKSYICAYMEVPGRPWQLFITMEENDMIAERRGMFVLILAIGLGCLIVGIIIAMFIGRLISRPMLYVANSLKDISEGDGDLTHTININTKDETGDLAHYFNMTIAKIRDLIGTIKTKLMPLQTPVLNFLQI